jgi:hypothetical protein
MEGNEGEVQRKDRRNFSKGCQRRIMTPKLKAFDRAFSSNQIKIKWEDK